MLNTSNLNQRLYQIWFFTYYLTFWLALRRKCPYSEFFWSVFFCIWTEYGEIFRISRYLVQMWENMDQKISECGRTLFTQCSPIRNVQISWKMIFWTIQATKYLSRLKQQKKTLCFDEIKNGIKMLNKAK